MDLSESKNTGVYAGLAPALINFFDNTESALQLRQDVLIN
jgi:hypothetical protein